MAESVTETLEQQRWLDPVAEPLSATIRGTFERAGESGRQLKDALHGTWLGHPLHPVLTDIPLGAWMTAAVLDTASAWTGDRGYERAAQTAVGFGLTGAVATAVTGLTDWSETHGEARRVGLVHGLLNVVATTLYASSYAARRNGRHVSGRGLAFAGLTVGMAAAYLGGSLVYREAIGVRRIGDSQPMEGTAPNVPMDTRQAR